MRWRRRPATACCTGRPSRSAWWRRWISAPLLGIGAPALADRAAACSRASACRSDYERRFDAQAQAGLTVDKKRRGSTIRFVFVPTPGDTRLVEIAPADITSHLVRRNPYKRSQGLDATDHLRVQRQSRMSGPFRENIKKLVERLDGGVAAVLMGFDGHQVGFIAKRRQDGAPSRHPDAGDGGFAPPDPRRRAARSSRGGRRGRWRSSPCAPNRDAGRAAC
jgi:hypothetical protein